MGEGRRRKALETRLRPVHREGQGLMQISVFTPTQAAEMMLLAENHTELVGDVMLIGRTLRDFYRLRHTPKSMLCFCCGGPLECPIALVAITPHTDHPTKAITGVICPTCHGTEHEMKDRAFAAWREQVDPTARLLMVPAAGGRGMTRDQLLSALANRMIDMAADVRSDLPANFHRSVSLDRLRRLSIVCLKLEPMFRALAEHISQTDRGTAHTELLKFADTLNAEWRTLARDIAALEDNARRQQPIRTA